MTEQRGIGSPAWTQAALAAVAANRADPSRPVSCPTCSTPGVGIIDRSVPPHAQWYILSCTACGLQHTLHIPMAPPLEFD
jgi:transcription elongation factor Elf1